GRIPEPKAPRQRLIDAREGQPGVPRRCRPARFGDLMEREFYIFYRSVQNRLRTNYRVDVALQPSADLALPACGSRVRPRLVPALADRLDPRGPSCALRHGASWQALAVCPGISLQ